MPGLAPKAQALSATIKTYYETLDSITSRGATNEGATRTAFQNLLTDWSKPARMVVLAEQTIAGTRKQPVRPDGVLVDDLKLRRGYWEAKDTKDDLEAEINKKIMAGYPLSNMLFEDTRQGVLYQDGQRRFVANLRQSTELRQLLEMFVNYQPPLIEDFHKAVAQFRQEIPNLAADLTKLIDKARLDNPQFKAALESFLELCRTALNPETTPAQVEDMLKQHILTERIFRSIFQNSDFVQRNAVAVELEKMVKALTSHSFSREAFLGGLDYFYRPIEDKARDIKDYDEKQAVLNTLYEQFFQAYSTRAADTNGIVYTPPPIVSWMVGTVQQALQSEFGQRLESPDVHIIDPAVGTGTFVMELIRRIPTSSLPDKYAAELHANEVLLLPYYIAALNIEHAYFERTGEYAPFEGICFADTLDLTNEPQPVLPGFAPANTERIEAQKHAHIKVIIGNPPYNVGQENENDNNKNRKHKYVDKRISETYAKASKASNKNALSDPYVKFFRWATDRLNGQDGIVCFVSNNSFIDQIAFDGMRKCLLQDFTRIYTFDMGGNVRKNPKLSGSKHNVFGIQVGVTITLLVRNSQHTSRELFYARVDECWTKEQKLKHLEEVGDYTQMEWQPLTPDNRNTWLTAGLNADFDSFLPMGSKEGKADKGLKSETIFKTYNLGVSTNRDDWVYSVRINELERKIKLFIETYNGEVDRWARRGSDTTPLDNFVLYDDKLMKWSSTLKARLTQGQHKSFDNKNIRRSMYRPFSQQYLYYDNLMVHRPSGFHLVVPTVEAEQENSIICVNGLSSNKPFQSLMINTIPNHDLLVTTQCFPFYTYNEDGTGRRENITDWALAQFRTQYADQTISKLDIFQYVYAVLHAPGYRSAYVENLKRDLPRIPFVPTLETFRAYAEAGGKLAHLHRDYTEVAPYPLERVETPGMPLNWRVDERGMRLSADRTSLRYNDWLTLANIPAQVFDYKLGNRSALDWVIDQYRVSTDTRSGLRHDPNQLGEPRAIVRLVEQVVRVSLDTQAIIAALPPLA